MSRAPHPDSLAGIPPALRLLPAAGVVGWLVVAAYAAAYLLTH